MFKYRNENNSSRILKILNEGAMSDIAIGIDEIKKLANDEQGNYTCKLQDLDTMKQIAKEYNIEVEDGEDGTSATFKVPGAEPFTVSALEIVEGEAPAKSYVPAGPVKEEDDPEDVSSDELPGPTPEEIDAVNKEIRKIYVVKESCKDSK